MVKIDMTADTPVQDPTKAYADGLWRANPKLSPNSWRILAGRTVGKVAGRVASPFVEAQEPHLAAAIAGGMNLWFLNITDFAAQKAFFNTLNSTDIPREALTVVYEFPLEHGDKLAQELELLPLPDGINFTCPGALDIAQLEVAFTAAEEAIKGDHIGFYGLMHAGLVAPKGAFHVNLADVISCSQRAVQAAYGRRKRAGLKLINAPLNILELGALRLATHTSKSMDGTESDVSVLELAARGHIGLMAERPLSVDNGQGGWWLTDDDHTAPLRAELLQRLPALPYWHNNATPLENMCLNAVLSLPGVTSATVMPGVDFGQSDLMDKFLTPLLEQADFADVAPIIGQRA